MNILFACAEVAPYAKAGELGDIAGALPASLRRLGHNVCIVMPRYRVLDIDETTIEELLPSFNVYLHDSYGHGRLLLTYMDNDTPLYLLDFPAAFDREPLYTDHNGMYGYRDDDARFIVFCRGVMALAHHLHNVDGWNPDILHANDWHTGLIPNYLKFNDATGLPNTVAVFTIHNLAYQGKTDLIHALRLSELGFNTEQVYELPEDTFNFMLRGIVYADMVNTVSPQYAREILLPTFSEGLHETLQDSHNKGKLCGILNGIDTARYNPATDPYLADSGYHHYSSDDVGGKAYCKAALQAECGLEINPQRPLIAIVTRLIEQKGIDSIITILPPLLRLVEDVQIVLLGSDENEHYQATLRYFQSRYPNQFYFAVGLKPKLMQHIYAGCDMIMIPSLFEPCGSTHMIALRYGTVPIVRKIGGLADTISEGDHGNGFVFGEPTCAQWVEKMQDLAQASRDTQNYVFEACTIDHFLETILRALRVFRDHPKEWKALQLRGMQEDNSWDRAAKPYEKLYDDARAIRGLETCL